MEKRNISNFFVLCLVLFIYVAVVGSAFGKDCPSYVTACGTPQMYELTMQNLQISTSTDGSSPLSIVETNQAFDIANANAGATVGSWFSGASIPPGDYVWMKRTLSRTFRIQGWVSYGGTTYYTSSSPDTTNFGASTNLNDIATASFDSNDPPSDYAAVSYTADDPSDLGGSLPSGVQFTDSSIVETDTSMTISVQRGKTMTMQISFNVTNTLELQDTDSPNGKYKLSTSEPDVSATVTTQ